MHHSQKFTHPKQVPFIIKVLEVQTETQTVVEYNKYFPWFPYIHNADVDVHLSANGQETNSTDTVSGLYLEGAIDSFDDWLRNIYDEVEVEIDTPNNIARIKITDSEPIEAKITFRDTSAIPSALDEYSIRTNIEIDRTAKIVAVESPRKYIENDKSFIPFAFYKSNYLRIVAPEQVNIADRDKTNIAYALGYGRDLSPFNTPAGTISNAMLTLDHLINVEDSLKLEGVHFLQGSQRDSCAYVKIVEFTSGTR